MFIESKNLLEILASFIPMTISKHIMDLLDNHYLISARIRIDLSRIDESFDKFAEEIYKLYNWGQKLQNMI